MNKVETHPACRERRRYRRTGRWCARRSGQTLFASKSASWSLSRALCIAAAPAPPSSSWRTSRRKAQLQQEGEHGTGKAESATYGHRPRQSLWEPLRLTLAKGSGSLWMRGFCARAGDQTEARGRGGRKGRKRVYGGCGKEGRMTREKRKDPRIWSFKNSLRNGSRRGRGEAQKPAHRGQTSRGQSTSPFNRSCPRCHRPGRTRGWAATVATGGGGSRPMR